MQSRHQITWLGSALLLLALLVMRFRTLLAMLVVAAILAYLLDPLIVFSRSTTPLRPPLWTAGRSPCGR